MRPNLPYKLSIVFGVVVLTREIVSLVQQIHRFRRPDYDTNRHAFRPRYKSNYNEETFREKPYGQTYEHKEDPDQSF